MFPDALDACGFNKRYHEGGCKHWRHALKRLKMI
jgi:hypothetical protein